MVQMLKKLEIKLSFAKYPPLPTPVPADKWFSQNYCTGPTYLLPSAQTETLPASATGPETKYTALNSPFPSMVDQDVPQVTAEKHSNNVITPSQETATADTNNQQSQEVNTNNDDTENNSDDENMTIADLAKKAKLKKKQTENTNEDESETVTEDDSNESTKSTKKKRKKKRTKKKKKGKRDSDKGVITTNRKNKIKLQISKDDSTTSNVSLADVSNDSSDVTFHAKKMYKVSKKKQKT